MTLFLSKSFKRVKYKDIAAVLNNEEVEENTKLKIKKLHNNNLHKFNTPTYRKNND